MTSQVCLQGAGTEDRDKTEHGKLGEECEVFHISPSDVAPRRKGREEDGRQRRIGCDAFIPYRTLFTMTNRRAGFADGQ